MYVKKESEILYYQWIPFLLLIKAFLFYAPRMSWNTFGTKSGVQIADLVESSFDYKLPTTDATHRQMCLNYVVNTIDDYCNDHRRQVECTKTFKYISTNFFNGLVFNRKISWQLSCCFIYNNKINVYWCIITSNIFIKYIIRV